MATCPNCGHVHTQTRTKRQAVTLPERADLDRAYARGEMTKDQYFAACKRINLRDDVRFLIRVAGDDLRAPVRDDAFALLAELESRASTAADGKRLNSIRDRYRMSKGSLKAERKAA